MVHDTIEIINSAHSIHRLLLTLSTIKRKTTTTPLKEYVHTTLKQFNVTSCYIPSLSKLNCSHLQKLYLIYIEEEVLILQLGVA